MPVLPRLPSKTHSMLALAALLALGAASHAGAAERLVVDTDHASVLFFVNHFGLSDRNGRFTGLDGTLDLDRAEPQRSSLTVTAKPATVSTGVPALDDHLRTADFLDTDRFPEARFTSTRVLKTGPQTAEVTGDLSLHGVTRPVTFTATFTGSGLNPATNDTVTGFRAEAEILRSEFGIKTFMPGVGDRVQLRIDAEFKVPK